MTAHSVKLYISIFGGMHWSFANQKLPTTNKKLCALIAYLALNGSSSISRERLAGVLWSENEEAKARASLRQVLKQLKTITKNVGFEGLIIDRDSISLAEGAFEIEAEKLCQDLESFIIDPAQFDRLNVTETILHGYEDIDPSFWNWLMAIRQNYFQRMLRISESGFKNQNLSVQVRGAFAEMVLRLDKSYEPARQYLMVQKTLAGDVAGAIRLYNELWDYLDAEYDLEPSEETIDLIAKIKTGDLSPVSSENYRGTLSSATNLVKKKPRRVSVINVELIEDSAASEDSKHYVRGFRHQIISSLAKFREWKVGDNVTELGDIDKETYLIYSLQSTAHSVGNDLGIVLTMKDVFSGLIVWSDTLTFGLSNWAEIHNRVITRIAMTLNVEVSAQKLSEILSVDAALMDSYEQWLYGQSLIMQFDPSSWNNAKEMLQVLVENHTGFAPAYSSLAQLGNTWHIAQPGIFRSDYQLKDTLSIAKSSVDKDPLDSRSHLALAWSSAFAEQFQQSSVHFDLAIELNEYDPWTILSAAQGYAFLGDAELSSKYSSRSIEMAFHPQPPYWGYHAGINFMNGNYEAALETAHKAGDSLVNNGLWRSASHYHLGDKQSAAEELANCFDLIRTKWIGNKPPDNERITHWLSELFPIRHVSDRSRLHAPFSLLNN